MSIEGVVARTGEKILTGKCVQCKRKNSMIVSDNKTAAEGLNKIKRIFWISAEAGKKQLLY